jgi:hypothetical protein
MEIRATVTPEKMILNFCDMASVPFIAILGEYSSGWKSPFYIFGRHGDRMRNYSPSGGSSALSPVPGSPKRFYQGAEHFAGRIITYF